MTADEFIEDEVTIEAVPPKRVRFPAFEYKGNGKSYDNLVLRPPTLGQLLEASRKAGAMEQQAHLLGAVAGIPPQVVHLLPPQVLRVAEAYFTPFMQPFPEAGTTE
jgi:hypothetical protein